MRARLVGHMRMVATQTRKRVRLPTGIVGASRTSGAASIASPSRLVRHSEEFGVGRRRAQGPCPFAALDRRDRIWSWRQLETSWWTLRLLVVGGLCEVSALHVADEQVRRPSVVSRASLAMSGTFADPTHASRRGPVVCLSGTVSPDRLLGRRVPRVFYPVTGSPVAGESDLTRLRVRFWSAGRWPASIMSLTRGIPPAA